MSKPRSAMLGAAALVLLCAGCGSSSGSASTGTDSPSTVPSHASAAASPASASATPDGLQPIGSYHVVENPNESVDLAVRAGSSTHLGKNQDFPPADVQAACHDDYAPTEAQSVYIQVTLTITLNASLPTTVTIDGTHLLGSVTLGNNLAALAAFQRSDGWECLNPDGGGGVVENFAMTPGTPITVPVWFSAPILSNSKPDLDSDDADTFYLIPSVTTGDGTRYPTITASGSNAAVCDDDPQRQLLLLIGKPLLTVTDSSGEQATCRAIQ